MSQKPSGGGKPQAKKNPLALPEGINKRCDLPPEAYWHIDRSDYTPLAVRPGYNTTGQAIRVAVNQFRVQSVGTRDVFQYDVAVKLEVKPEVKDAPEPRAIVYKKIWASSIVQGKLAQAKAGPWLYDNRKLAWSTNNIPGFSCTVDLGADEGRPGRKNNTFTFEMKQTCKVRMEALKAYLEKRMAWDNTVLECMSFLDHVLRQGPSERMHMLKRTFINEHSETRMLNGCTEAIKGIYSAIRLNESINNGGLGLGINVDITNQTFWVGQRFDQLARNFLGSLNSKWLNMDYNGLRTALQPTKIPGTTTFGMSEAFKALRRMQNIRFRVNHRGNKQDIKEYKVKRIAFKEEYGAMGACAKSVTFEKTMPDGSKKTYNIADYYLEQYKTKIQHWYLPLIETTSSGFFPMEVCEVVRFNPYPFKLDPDQTAAMIKFSQAPPKVRKPEVMKMVQNLNWAQDRYLAHFGIKINPTMPMIAAKLLPNPIIQFGNKTHDPKMGGRWDLRGIKFLSSNKQELKAWGIVVMDSYVDDATAKRFASSFRATYIGHGGKVATGKEDDPFVVGFQKNKDPDAVMSDAYSKIGAHFNRAPQIIFVILANKTAGIYERLKRNADCRWGCLTQMVQGQHAKKCAPQYLSNVAMKVNAKLGGQTSRIAHKAPATSTFTVPTMMIGVDISHGNTGVRSASTAAMCVSMDKEATVYDAAVQTNGFGVEIVQPANMYSMLGPLCDKWRATLKVVPEHVFYMRDGVSEGQFAHVMEFEVGEMRKVFKQAYNKVPKITVIVCTKRHHIRIFPERGDRNENCLPGTLLEREVTHPFHYDFYLCSHVALQGTARPVHYNVIHDECALKPDVLQRILYNQCYQYCRSTTPVSLHPAVYYAHLAGARARHHESGGAEVKIGTDNKHLVLQRPGPMAKSDAATTTTAGQDSMPPPLLRIGQYNPTQAAAAFFMKNTMWWV